MALLPAPSSRPVASSRGGRWICASRERLPYLYSGYPNPLRLLEATQANQVDIGVGCLTIAPERVGRYRFSLPFQEEGLALLLPSDGLAGAAGC